MVLAWKTIGKAENGFRRERSRRRDKPMTTQPNSRPNIIVCLVDDLGFSDIGCYGSEIRTPNLDRMGNNGLRFTQMYNAARCCPSRAALANWLVSASGGRGTHGAELRHARLSGLPQRQLRHCRRSVEERRLSHADERQVACGRTLPSARSRRGLGCRFARDVPLRDSAGSTASSAYSAATARCSTRSP